MSDEEKPTPDSPQVPLRARAYQEETQALREDLAKYVLQSTAAQQFQKTLDRLSPEGFVALVREALSEGGFRTNLNTDLEAIRKSIDELRDEFSAFKKDVLGKLDDAHNRQISLGRAREKVSETLLDNTGAEQEALHEEPKPNPLPPVVPAVPFPESPAQTGGKPADRNAAVIPAHRGQATQTGIMQFGEWWKRSTANLNSFSKILVNFLLAALFAVIALGAGIILAALIWIF